MGAGLLVVTGASSNHYGPLRYMLESLRRLRAHVACYDLGLSAREVARLPRWDGFRYHTFDYASHPAHMDVAVNAGEYAWKPAIVADVVARVGAAAEPCDVLWADAGCYFHELAPMAARIAESGGLWVRASRGTMAEWTHPAMFEFLGADPAAYGARPNADATLVGFATGSGPVASRDAVVRTIVLPWRACAMERECIAPRGSSRRNHRQDQAVLSYLVHRAGYRFAAESWRTLGVRTKCDRWFYEYVGFRVPHRVYARCCLS